MIIMKKPKKEKKNKIEIYKEKIENFLRNILSATNYVAVLCRSSVCSLASPPPIPLNSSHPTSF